MKYCKVERTIASMTAVMFFGLSAMACDSESDNILSSLSDADRGKIEQALAAFTEGTILSIEEETEDGENSVEVEWQTPGGATIEVELDRNNNCALLEAEAEGGPFNYDFDPGMGLIKLSTATANALDSQAGTLEKWELEQDDSSNSWIYEFEIEDAAGDDWDIEIDATDGAVLSAEKS